MKQVNPFKVLPFILLAQITLAIILGGTPVFDKDAVQRGLTDSENLSTVSFPDSDTSLRVELADTEEERRIGLMNRTELSIDRGMLFVFPEEDYRGFWMKNTLIPLDMIFVDAEGRILNIEEAYPGPNTSDEELETYRSKGEAKYVIEANSSFTERNNIGEGDRVRIPTRVR